MNKDAEKRIKRAVQTAREAVAADPTLKEIKLKRFHAACDALKTIGERESVYDILRKETWYELASQALARVK